MKKFAIVAVLAFALAGCGTHLTPLAGSATAAALAAQSHKKAATAKNGKRPTPPQTKKTTARQGIAASQAAGDCGSTLATYQNLTYQWNSAFSDADKDNVESQMLQVLHQGLQNVESITSANGVDATDRQSYDIADAGLNRYDAAYSSWSSTWDPNAKRVIANQMMTDMVNTLQQIQANY